MAIQPNEQYVLKGKQIQDLALKMSDVGETVSAEDWNNLFSQGIRDADEIGY